MNSGRFVLLFLFTEIDLVRVRHELGIGVHERDVRASSDLQRRADDRAPSLVTDRGAREEDAVRQGCATAGEDVVGACGRVRTGRDDGGGHGDDQRKQ